MLPHLKQLLQLHLDATTSEEHASLLQYVVSTLRSQESSQRGLYRVVRGRLCNDAGWQPFLRHAAQLADFCTRIEGTAPTQSQSDLLQSYFIAHQTLPRFNIFVEVRLRVTRISRITRLFEAVVTA